MPHRDCACRTVANLFSTRATIDDVEDREPTLLLAATDSARAGTHAPISRSVDAARPMRLSIDRNLHRPNAGVTRHCGGTPAGLFQTPSTS